MTPVSRLILSFWLYVYIIHHAPTQVRLFHVPSKLLFTYVPSVLELARIVTQLGRLAAVKFICHFDGLSVSTEMLKSLTVLIENIPSSHLVCRG
jgi:hypothetical protein